LTQTIYNWFSISAIRIVHISRNQA